MGALDAPGVLIIGLLLAAAAWAVYNWTHRDASARK